MKLFPAVDLFEGQAVRLFQGDYAQKTVYSSDPVSVADSFREQGAEYIHLVDLEGARSGTTPNLTLIQEMIRSSGLKAEIGGGIRSAAVVESYLNAGAMRVILGTAAIENPAFLRDMVAAYGDKIAVGVDLKDGFVATHGWVTASQTTWQTFLEELHRLGVGAVICTDISRDGAMKGTNLELYRQIRKQFPQLELIASGGVSCLEDVLALRDIAMPGAILGKALYEKKLDLREALRVCREDKP